MARHDVRKERQGNIKLTVLSILFKVIWQQAVANYNTKWNGLNPAISMLRKVLYLPINLPWWLSEFEIESRTQHTGVGSQSRITDSKKKQDRCVAEKKCQNYFHLSLKGYTQ